MDPIALTRQLYPSAAPSPPTNVVAVAVLLGFLGAGAAAARASGSPVPLVVMTILGLVLMQAPRVARQWERAVVLRLGRFVRLPGPRPFWLWPVLVQHSVPT